jgi:hypothetical protein
LETLVKADNSICDNNFLAELSRSSLNILYHFYTNPGCRAKIDSAQKESWSASLRALKGEIEKIPQDVPSNVLYFEVDMMQKGVEILPDNNKMWHSLLTKGLGGTFRFLSTGDPTA